MRTEMRGQRKVRRLLGRSGWLLFLKLPILVYLVEKLVKAVHLYLCTWKMCPVFSPPLHCAVEMVLVLGQAFVLEPAKN